MPYPPFICRCVLFAWPLCLATANGSVAQQVHINSPQHSASIRMEGVQGSSRSVVSQTPSLTVTNGGAGYFMDGQIRPFVIGWVPVVGGFAQFPGVPYTSFNPPLPPYMAPQAYYHPLPDTIARWAAAQGDSSEMQVPSEERQRQAAREIVARTARIEQANQERLARNPSSAQRGDLSVADIRRQQAATDAAITHQIADHLTTAQKYLEQRDFRLALRSYRKAERLATGEQKEKLREKIRLLQSSF